MWYNISCLTGPEHGGWSKFFDDILTRTLEKDINADTFGDSITLSTDFAEGFVWTEFTTTVVTTCLIPMVSASSTTYTLYPETSNYPC
jgi:hypothetical protein